jgi:signal transduction histidine kinase
LIAALQIRLESVEARSGVHIDFIVEGEKQLPNSVEAELYRIAQEALNNCVKHSQADRISVHIKYSDKIFSMQISDNGIGFDTKSITQSSGMGLRGMKERVKRINGGIEVLSKPGEGTTLQVKVDI